MLTPITHKRRQPAAPPPLTPECWATRRSKSGDFFGTISQQVSSARWVQWTSTVTARVSLSARWPKPSAVEFAWPLPSPLPPQTAEPRANSAGRLLLQPGASESPAHHDVIQYTGKPVSFPGTPAHLNGTTNNTVFEGSYIGASSFSSWEDFSGNNRRMLEVRTKKYASALDNAVLLRTCDNGQWAQHRVFHAGMETPVPVMNGGTGANNASSARAPWAKQLKNERRHAACRTPVPYIWHRHHNGVSSVYIYQTPVYADSVVIAAYSYHANWSRQRAIKVHDKTIYGCGMIVGGAFNTNRTVDWFAFGV